MAKSPARSSRRSSKRKPISRTPHGRKGWVLLLFGLGLIVSAAYVAYLNHVIVSQFEDKRFELPARVYASPVQLYAGRRMTQTDLLQALGLLRYAVSPGAAAARTYQVQGDGVLLHTRGFESPDGTEPSRLLRVRFADGRIAALTDASGQPVALARLAPLLIAKIYPRSHEDRILVRMSEMPPLLPKALVAVEDRRFYEHHGVDPVAIGRALVADIRARRFVQGGSTLTQQLVKNFFLSNQRSLWRKFNEAIMAVLLETHYSKAEILETYLNEVYLGQQGSRAIHGVGLASEFYFDRPVQSLDTAQVALLVALVRGPTYYDPRRHPGRALERRNLVLSEMASAGLISAAQARTAQAAPLGVGAEPASGITPFPAFLDLVEAQLARDYRAEDLRTEGLMIYTTLRPLVQLDAQQAVRDGLRRIERTHGMRPDTLEAAAVVTSVADGEVLAVVGGRRDVAGFNRALDTRRSIGSLFKPAIYLAALEQPQRFTLATPLDDSPLTVTYGNAQQWSPVNYDRQYHGKVTVMDALVHSYNVPSVRLGLSVGLDKVIEMAHRLGIAQPIDAYPASLLGSAAVPPIQMAQMYQTIAAGGYRAPLRAIQAVVDPRGEKLQRYPLRIEQVADGKADYLLTAAMHEVTRRGTAASLQTLLPGVEVAGKTGTTNDLRDSWFAGFGGRETAVVWVGRDDNRPTGLTGSSGALPLWAGIMGAIHASPLQMSQPADVVWQTIDPASGQRLAATCPGAEWMPFIKGSVPSGEVECRAGVLRQAIEWFKGLMQ
ncbi:penicillin-binding protein 1B [Acidihalobacter aeolianus]|uniref:Penicillin-binding protein 1B n=1 Tax=Acidihalobacter aeolianus TaxID=2792603 RepID=A0A1D8K8B3_9GAMM|nr:penicillin-binding protein 1B [Acidihalobacter aeolianus]AOV17172.1 penicillin-binding protein 1B [Acidihalobacter aeolianus]